MLKILVYRAHQSILVGIREKDLHSSIHQGPTRAPVNNMESYCDSSWILTPPLHSKPRDPPCTSQRRVQTSRSAGRYPHCHVALPGIGHNDRDASGQLMQRLRHRRTGQGNRFASLTRPYLGIHGGMYDGCPKTCACEHSVGPNERAHTTS